MKQREPLDGLEPEHLSLDSYALDAPFHKTPAYGPVTIEEVQEFRRIEGDISSLFDPDEGAAKGDGPLPKDIYDEREQEDIDDPDFSVYRPYHSR